MMTRLTTPICALLLGVLLAGCGADSSDSGASTAGDMAADGPASAAQAEAGSAQVEPADVDKAAAAPAPDEATARRVRTAEITVEVKDVAAAARAVRTAAVSLAGVVSSENTTFGEEDDARSEITLRVPEPKLDDALSRIAAAGSELDRSTTSEDVTATIVDLNSRVATQTRSVARVRELLDRANSLEDVVLLESELARRESDLESIQARQRALVDKAALATITVTLIAPGAVEQEPAEAGFLAGLTDGWTALKASTTVVLTVLGALLPVAIVVALIGVPVYLLRNRFKPRGQQVVEPPAPPAADPVTAPAP